MKDPHEIRKAAIEDAMLRDENPPRISTDPDNARWSALTEAQRNMRTEKARRDKIDGLLKKHFTP